MQWIVILLVGFVVSACGEESKSRENQSNTAQSASASTQEASSESRSKALPGPVSLDSLPSLEKGKNGQLLDFQYDMPLRPITARESSLESLQGQVTLVFFFSATCGHCQQAAPHLLKIAEEYKDSGLNMVAIATKHNRDPDIAKFLQEQKVTVPVFQDAHRAFSKNYGTGSVPVVLLVNQRGQILKFKGYKVGQTGSKIRRALANKHLFG